MGHLQCFEIEDESQKEKQAAQEKKNKNISLPLVPSRLAGLLVLRLRVCRRCLRALGVTERGTRAHTLSEKEKIEYHPELEEHDSKELVIFSALQHL